jgi:hypothetical protein
MPNMPSFFGYYCEAGQEDPTYDPGPSALCPHCGRPVGLHGPNNPIQTPSLMAVGSDRSYFYRVHKARRSAASAADISEIEAPIIDGVH